MTDEIRLCRVPGGLRDHVLDLLRAAEVDCRAEPTGGRDYEILVHPGDREKGESVIALVLPQLLNDGESDTGSGLADNLTRREDEPTIRPLPVWRGPERSVLDADDVTDPDDFVPPPPPPVPRPRDRIARFAWAAAIGGPLFSLIATLIGLSGTMILLGILASFAGFATLVARSPEQRHPDDPGNGAIV